MKLTKVKEPSAPLSKLIVDAWTRFSNFWDKRRKPEADNAFDWYLPEYVWYDYKQL